MRDAAINLRAFPEQRDLIDRAAQLLGKNRSDFMLEAACDKALYAPTKTRGYLPRTWKGPQPGTAILKMP